MNGELLYLVWCHLRGRKWRELRGHLPGKLLAGKAHQPIQSLSVNDHSRLDAPEVELSYCEGRLLQREIQVVDVARLVLAFA